MRIKTIIQDLWSEKYMFIFCFIVAFIFWQGIKQNIIAEKSSGYNLNNYAPMKSIENNPSAL